MGSGFFLTAAASTPPHILLHLRLAPHLDRKETLEICLCISKSPNLKRHTPKSLYCFRVCHYCGTSSDLFPQKTQVLNFITQESMPKKKVCFSLHRKLFLPMITVLEWEFRQLLRFELCWFPCLPQPACFPLPTTKNYHNERPSCNVKFLPQIRPYPAPAKPVTSHLIVGPSSSSPAQ